MSGSKRPKGYISNWTPQPKTLELIQQVKQVLRDYDQYLPLTARQIFYRLVGQFHYDKTELAYSRLCEALVKARRAQMISFSAIRDDGTFEQGGGGWDDVDQWWRGELHSAKGYRRDRMAGQPVRIEVWCEAAGMAPQLARIAAPYGVGMYSTGGFSSVTVTHEIAKRATAADVPTVFMHIGDFDPSGESIFDAMAQDVGAFVVGEFGGTWNSATGETKELKTDRGCGFRPVRVALTAEQVEEHDLPTAPPKRSDSRSANWAGETCQAEAMDPGTLGEILREAIEGHVDEETRESVIAEEEEERAELVSTVEEQIAERGE